MKTDFQAQIEFLSEEINKLGTVIASAKYEVTYDLFLFTLIKGGLIEMIQDNGGRILKFSLRDDLDEKIILQEFLIPDLGLENNLRGFLLSANDGSDTLPFDPKERLSALKFDLDIEMQDFFEGLHKAVINALSCGSQIEVELMVAA